MREILFKAKRVENGEWIEGYYYKVQETVYCFKEDYEKNPVPIHHFIIFTKTTDWGLPMQVYQTEIIPETLCQFTGLCDKNGKKIWENDICDRKEKYPEVVKMANGDWTLDYSYAIGRDYGNSYCNLGFYVNERKCVEVIGNIFDNPELLQEESNE